MKAFIDGWRISLEGGGSYGEREQYPNSSTYLQPERNQPTSKDEQENILFLFIASVTIFTVNLRSFWCCQFALEQWVICAYEVHTS